MKLIILLFFISCQSQSLNKYTDHKLVKVGSDLNLYREALSSGIDVNKPVTKQVFKVTCMPVGKRIKKLKKRKGITVRQVSHKNRNPKNIVPESFNEYYQEFLNNPKLDHKIIKIDKKEYALKRITTQESCLSCHGNKEARPKFVKKKYKADKAHSFKSGELRGIYIISKD